MRLNRDELAARLATRVEPARERVVWAPMNSQAERDAVVALSNASRLATQVKGGEGEWVEERELIAHMADVIRLSSPDIPWSRREAKAAAKALMPLFVSCLETQREIDV